jgi:hypothetical protein
MHPVCPWRDSCYRPDDIMAWAPDEITFFKTVYKRKEDPVVAAVKKKQELREKETIKHNV